MKAITIEPKKPGTARLEDVPEPDERDGSVLVEAIAVGVCGTDVEIVEGKYGWARRGKTRLVLGHESLGRVLDPGPTSGLQKGDLVVGIVRRPDPVPCPNCAVGEWDMCRNGQYTERGIKQIDGFMSERWRIEPEYVMKVDRSLGLLGVLLEPTTVVAKAWEQIVSGRPARLLGAADRARDGGGADRPARRPRRQAARAGGPRPRPCRIGAASPSWCAPSARPTTPATSRTSGSSRTSSSNAPASGRSSPMSIQDVGAGGIVCLTGVGSGGGTVRARHG